jgi:hypothetical protein
MFTLGDLMEHILIGIFEGALALFAEPELYSE